jgi:hypothetical protein
MTPALRRRIAWILIGLAVVVGLVSVLEREWFTVVAAVIVLASQAYVLRSQARRD